jgi:hypothetical protein
LSDRIASRVDWSLTAKWVSHGPEDFSGACGDLSKAG